MPYRERALLTDPTALPRALHFSRYARGLRNPDPHRGDESGGVTFANVYRSSGRVSGPDLLKGMRSKSASVGANGLVINSLGATHATVKVIGAAVGGNDAERKGQAIAIWMPSDTARVREACGK